MKRWCLALATPLLCLMLAMPALAEPAAVATPSAIPYKQDKQGGGASAYQSIAALVLAGLAAYGVVLGLKHFRSTGTGPLRTTRRLRMIESIRLSRRSTLHLIDYDGEQLLLSESEHGVRLLRSRGDGKAAQGAADA